jgi:uncharacterized OB-fold protein
MPKREVDDRFKKFGTVSFTAITRTNDFVGNLSEGRVTGTKCKGCGATWFPPRADCAKCLGSEMEWFDVSGDGELLSFSELQYGPVGFEDDLPYTIALLDFGGYKVFGRIAKELPYDELKIGMKMKAAARELAEGQLTYVFERA